jgi:hypothetical protein
MHAAYKKITATHRVIKLRVLKTRKLAKPSSDKSSSTLITRVIKRESDDQIDLITSKHETTISIPSINTTAQRVMLRLNQRVSNKQVTTNNIKTKGGYKCHLREVPAKAQRPIDIENNTFLKWRQSPQFHE